MVREPFSRRMPLPGLLAWLNRVHEGLAVNNRAYPFLAYGTDWLAFAHLVIAVAFIGPWRDPVRNRWVIEFGLIACAGSPLPGHDCRADSRDSHLLAADRLQLRSLRRCPPGALPERYPEVGTSAGLIERCANGGC